MAVSHALRRDTPLAAVLVLPALLILGVFVIYPLVRTAWLGFFLQDPFGRSARWVGLDQYQDVLTSDSFRNSISVTSVFVLLTVPTSLVLGVLLAALANQQLRGIRVFRTIFASTIATSVAVASMLWLILLEPSTGILNQFLESIGRDPVNVLNDPDTALVAVSLTTVWQNLGLAFVVTVAAMQSIPDVLYESARVDGHGSVSRFFRITVPMLGPQLLFLTIILTIVSFESFGQIDILTEGGPQDSTNVIVYSIVERMPLDQGAASVEAVLLFLIVGTLSVVQFRWLDRRVHHGD
ncbi:MAG: sugar ABC transporter permease [Acidimicrobiia bacterium]|nr:sugar ABC transporter permease [Acidimicrobiia bacterium]